MTSWWYMYMVLCVCTTNYVLCAKIIMCVQIDLDSLLVACSSSWDSDRAARAAIVNTQLAVLGRRTYLACDSKAK